MAANLLELVIDVQAEKANANIRSTGRELDVFEKAALRASRNSAQGFDGMIRQMAGFREGTAKAFAIAGVVAYGERFGHALAGMVVNLIDWQTTLERVKSTVRDVFSPIEAANRELRDANRLEAVTKQAERILESQVRVRQLQQQVRLAGLEGQARISAEFEAARSALVSKPEFIGLPAGQKQAELLALTQKFSQEMVAVRRKEAEQIAEASRKNAEAMLQQAFEQRRTEDSLIEQGMEVLRRGQAERLDLARSRFEFETGIEARRIDASLDVARQIRQIGEETQLLRLSGVERTLKQIEFAEQHRVEELRRLERSGLVGGAEIQRAIRATQDGTDVQRAAAIKEESDRVTKSVMDEQTRIFQSLKQQAGGVLDALLDKSTSVWQAIANTFRATMLTAIKDVASSWIANILMPIFGAGGGGARGGFGARGTASALGGILPSVFGGGIPGIGPGGTPPFIPGPVGGGVGGGSAGGFAGFGAANLASLKSFLGLGGRTAAGGIGPTLPFGQMGLGGKLSAIGKSDAALFAGAALALDGIRRGGALGLAETTGGGALIGFRFGGPVGAVVGAVVGFGVGLVGLFRKSAEKKAREKIKATYGIDISDKGILTQIVQIARQSFGGNLDVAIRAPQLREMIELYAMTTAQSTAAFPVGLRPLGLLQSGGSIFSLQGGQSSPLASFGGPLPSLSRPAAAPIETTVRVEIPLTLDGKVIESKTIEVLTRNGRAVSAAVVSGMRANAGRRESTALQFAPGLVTS